MAILPNMHSVSYISSGTMFQCEFSNDVCFVIRVIEKKKFLKILSRSRSGTKKCLNTLLRPRSRTRKFLKYNVMYKIQDSIQVVACISIR